MRNSAFRKEFKIQGNIGDSDKPRQTFAYLERQIEEGKKALFTDEEIGAGIIKALTPGLPIRDYLETNTELSLEEITEMLNHHFQEKSASEQLLALQNIIQGEEENVRAFLFRAFSTRDKLLKAAEKDSTMLMSKEFVQGLFLRAVETGMTDDKVLMCIRPMLQMVSVTDQQLMKQVQYSMASYAERDSKQKQPVPLARPPTTRRQQVNVVDPKKKEEESLLKVLVENMQKLATDFQGLKTDMSEMKSKNGNRNNNNNGGKVWFTKCDNCKAAKIQRCTHCYRCGSDEHKIADCTEEQQQEGGNEQRLQ